MNKNHKISEDFVRSISQRNLQVYAVPESPFYYRNVQNIDILRSIFLREINRLQTFNGYPQDGFSAIKLASNGFIYQGHGHEAVCVFCGSRYAEWRTEDDVQMIHRCLCPQCPMVTGEVVSNISLSGDVGQRIEGIHFRNDYEARLDTETSLASRVQLQEFRSEANVRDINEDRINTLEVTTSIFTPSSPSMIADITSVEYLTNNTSLMSATPSCPIAPENKTSSGRQTHNIENDTQLRCDHLTTLETNEMDTTFSITSDLTGAENGAQAQAFVQHDSETDVLSMTKLTNINTFIIPASDDSEEVILLCNNQIQTLRGDIPILPNSVPTYTNEDMLMVPVNKTDTLDTASHDFDLTQTLGQDILSFSSTHTAVNNLGSASTNIATDPLDRLSESPNETLFHGLVLKDSTTCEAVSSAIGLSEATNQAEALPVDTPTHLQEYIPVTSQETPSVQNIDSLVLNRSVISTNLTKVANNQNEMTFTIKSAQNLKEIIFECNDKQKIEIEEFNLQGSKGLYISCPTNFRSVIKLAHSKHVNNMNDVISINVQSDKSKIQSNTSEGKAIQSDVNLGKLRMTKAELKGRASRSDAIRIIKENVQQLKDKLQSDLLQQT
ncbi:death-associated inhibitor of apoptosis 1 [Biomphalaria pfeifferi]|uniref:Death-associated inhibitor of apoptosis 1 n=1 Tax=Biomphalaria pfeifferi TaxID=112525 RepID=A0AAD8BZ31_BIOPF|nr:death-associated inhibitor of apoptosis 1 [Biomphalaria pfeifferi]